VVGIHDAADADQVTLVEASHRRTDGRDPADDFVARHAWVGGGYEVGPLIADGVEIGVADAAEEDLDLDVGSVGWRRWMVSGARSEVALAAEQARISVMGVFNDLGIENRKR
jgi:hypothetical protein